MTRMRSAGACSQAQSARLGALLLAIVALTAAAPTTAASNLRKGPGDCNADGSFVLTPATPQAGGVVDVTIIITNTDSQEATPNPGAPIAQSYSKVSFWPSCSGSPPPCVPDNPLKAAFVPGSATTDCGPGVMTANPITFMGIAGGQIDFEFAPDMTLAPPLPSSCTISFQLQTDPALMAMDEVRFQATSFGTCNPGFGPQGAGSTDTGAITLAATVPALGGVALAVLALLLGAGAWRMLRQGRFAPTA